MKFYEKNIKVLRIYGADTKFKGKSFDLDLDIESR